MSVFGPVCIFKKKLNMSGLVLVLVGFLAFINTAGEKLNLLTLLWSSYPLTLATFLVELRNKKIYTYLSHNK